MSRVVRALQVSLVAAALVSNATPAHAQSVKDIVKRAGVGVDIGFFAPTDDEVDAGAVIGWSVSLKPSKGWGLAGGLGWYEGDLNLSTASGDDKVGVVRVRPLMAGVGYTWVQGRLATTAALTGGVSFNSADVDPDYQQIFGPGTRVSLEMDNSFCVRPSIKVEYELARKWAIEAFSGFFLTSVNSRLNTPAGTYENRWAASNFNGSVGVKFYPFQ